MVWSGGSLFCASPHRFRIHSKLRQALQAPARAALCSSLEAPSPASALSGVLSLRPHPFFLPSSRQEPFLAAPRTPPQAGMASGNLCFPALLTVSPGRHAAEALCKGAGEGSPSGLRGAGGGWDPVYLKPRFPLLSGANSSCAATGDRQGLRASSLGLARGSPTNLTAPRFRGTEPGGRAVRVNPHPEHHTHPLPHTVFSRGTCRRPSPRQGCLAGAWSSPCPSTPLSA